MAKRSPASQSVPLPSMDEDWMQSLYGAPPVEPRLDTDPTPAKKSRVATAQQPAMPLTPPLMPIDAMTLDARVPGGERTLPPDPTAHWGPICGATRMAITNMQLIVGAALTQSAKGKIDWAHVIPELRVHLYHDVKSVRDISKQIGYQDMFLKLAPLLKETKEQLARTQQDYQAEQALTQQLAAENKQLKEQLAVKGVPVIDGEEVLPGISLDAVLEHLESEDDPGVFASAADPVINLLSPVSQASYVAPSVSSEGSECTQSSESRQGGFIFDTDADELEELLPPVASFEVDAATGHVWLPAGMVFH